MEKKQSLPISSAHDNRDSGMDFIDENRSKPCNQQNKDDTPDKCANYDLCGNTDEGSRNQGLCIKCDITFGNTTLKKTKGMCGICMEFDEQCECYQFIKCNHSVCKSCFLNVFWPSLIDNDSDYFEEDLPHRSYTPKQRGWYTLYDYITQRFTNGETIHEIISRRIPKCPFCRTIQCPAWVKRRKYLVDQSMRSDGA